MRNLKIILNNKNPCVYVNEDMKDFAVTLIAGAVDLFHLSAGAADWH